MRPAVPLSLLLVIGTTACLDASGPAPNLVAGPPDLTGVVTQVTYQEFCIPPEAQPACLREYLVWLRTPPDTAAGAVVDVGPRTPVFIRAAVGLMASASATSIVVGDSMAVWWGGGDQSSVSESVRRAGILRPPNRHLALAVSPPLGASQGDPS